MGLNCGHYNNTQLVDISTAQNTSAPQSGVTSAQHSEDLIVKHKTALR